MPTWRRNLANLSDEKTFERTYDTEFKTTSYFKFYNQLINDERLLKALRDNGFTGVFVPHPSHIAQVEDYKGNDLISIVDHCEYYKVINESSLLITDYSSISIDFAYLNKPIIYAQFDKDEFYNNDLSKYDPIKEGYFDYERDGFGPVLYDYDSVVSRIIEMIENGCQQEPEYENRVNNFFAYRDNNNCKRVYDAIQNMLKNK